MLTDTHCHLYKEYYDDINKVILAAKNSNVNRYFNIGCDSASNEEVLESVDKYDNVYGIIGIHPEEADSYTSNDLLFIKDHINDQKIIGIGEIGLDYYYTKDNKVNQKVLFEDQLKIAEEYNKPVSIHSREATQDTIDILKKYNVKGIIHAFSGSLDVAKIYIKMGFKLGIGGVITFKNSNLKDVIKELSLDDIVLETDSPYLTPHPNRGKRNEPKYIYDIASFVALLFDVPINEVINRTNANICAIFDL